MTLGSTAIGVGDRWATIRGTTLGITDLTVMVGTVRGIILGTMATTAITDGVIPITTVGAILTGTILTMAGAAAMPIMARLAHAITESRRTISRAVCLTGVRTAIPAELSVARATAASAIAIQPHAATRVPFRVDRMAVTAIPTAISAGRARLRATIALQRVPATRRVTALRRTLAVRRRVMVGAVSVAHAVAVPRVAVVAAVVAADSEAAGNL